MTIDLGNDLEVASTSALHFIIELFGVSVQGWSMGKMNYGE